MSFSAYCSVQNHAVTAAVYYLRLFDFTHCSWALLVPMYIHIWWAEVLTEWYSEWNNMNCQEKNTFHQLIINGKFGSVWNDALLHFISLETFFQRYGEKVFIRFIKYSHWSKRSFQCIFKSFFWESTTLVVHMYMFGATLLKKEAKIKCHYYKKTVLILKVCNLRL